MDRLTEYTYNDTARSNTVKNAENEVTTLKYNQRFQTFEVKDAINQTYTFSYDPLGRLLSQTRADGTMSFEYDNVDGFGFLPQPMQIHSVNPALK